MLDLVRDAAEIHAKHAHLSWDACCQLALEDERLERLQRYPKHIRNESVDGDTGEDWRGYAEQNENQYRGTHREDGIHLRDDIQIWRGPVA